MSEATIGLDGDAQSGSALDAGDSAVKDAISEMISLWDELSRGNECPKGLEYMMSSDTNRILFMKDGCCGKSVLKDTHMQKVYNIKESGKCCGGESLLCTVEDFRKQEILRFVKQIRHGQERVIVKYRKTTIVGDVEYKKDSDNYGDSYLLFILNGPDGKELYKVFSSFDEVKGCGSGDVHSYVLQETYPFEIASFQHSSKALGSCCGTTGSCVRQNTFRVDFHESIDPLVKCLVVAAAYWRLREGFGRFKEQPT